jgi:uncharacterized protein (DUF427 family)
MTMRAIWNGVAVAESNDTVVVEGNHYFPVESLHQQYFIPSDHRSVCSWKGIASYRSISVNGLVNPDAAWEYDNPAIPARKVKDRVAFWHGVTVVSVDATHERAAG